MDAGVLQQAGLSTAGIAILFIAYRVSKAIIGHRLISDCCGRRMEMGLAIADMSGTSPPASVETLQPPPILESIKIPRPVVEDGRPSVEDRSECKEGNSHPAPESSDGK
jgi:hypothetical protein